MTGLYLFIAYKAGEFPLYIYGWAKEKLTLEFLLEKTNKQTILVESPRVTS